MVEVVVAQRMWQRRGTAAEWTTKNPILEAGEIGVELSSTTSVAHKIKIGNGTTPWSGLPYAADGGGGALDPTTTPGDMIRRGSTALERLPVGTNGNVMTVVAGMPSWALPPSGVLDNNQYLVDVSPEGVATVDVTAGKRFYFLQVSTPITSFKVVGRLPGIGSAAFVLIRQDGTGGATLNPDLSLRRSSVSEAELNPDADSYSLITMTSVIDARIEYRIEHMQPDESAPGVWMSLAALAADQPVVVPADVTSCTAYLIGAAGGGGIYSAGAGASGAGGYTTAVFPVTPGETLIVRAATGGGGAKKDTVSEGGLAGWPGGGTGSWGDSWGGGGGGHSGVFRSTTPLVIAGGGGGGSGYGAAAGAGGGATGGNGTGSTGGTQTAGGSGPYPGSAYQGANANGGDRLTSTSADGGGGGGGYFGGATGNGDGQTGSGGSGFVSGSASGNTYAGVGAARPTEIPITINGESTSTYGISQPGASNSPSTVTAANGGNGHVWLQFT